MLVKNILLLFCKDVLRCFTMEERLFQLFEFFNMAMFFAKEWKITMKFLLENTLNYAWVSVTFVVKLGENMWDVRCTWMIMCVILFISPHSPWSIFCHFRWKNFSERILTWQVDAFHSFIWCLIVGISFFTRKFFATNLNN